MLGTSCLGLAEISMEETEEVVTVLNADVIDDLLDQSGEQVEGGIDSDYEALNIQRGVSVAPRES